MYTKHTIFVQELLTGCETGCASFISLCFWHWLRHVVHNVLLALINLLVVYYLQMWILAAQFEVRQQRLDAARKILGMSLGMCPKDRTYKAYIEVSTAILALEYQVDTMTSCTDQA